METNTTDIIDAFKKHIKKRTAIDNKHKKIQDVYNKLTQDINNLQKLYSFIFKNINPDKKFVCDIDSYTDEYGGYYNGDNDDDIDYNLYDDIGMPTGYKYTPNKYKRKLFINRDGFSISNSFSEERKDVDVSRTNYLQTYNEKIFIKLIKRLLKHKNEIISSIEKDYKKSIAIRFFNALEQSGFDNLFHYEEDYDNLKQVFKEDKIIQYYNDNKIADIKIQFLKYKNASGNVLISNSRDWGSEKQINLTDIEKLSQIYVEFFEFLNMYQSKLENQDKSLINLNNILRDSFAKELILDSLKEVKQ